MYTRFEEDGQLAFENRTDFLRFPSCLFGLRNTEAVEARAQSGRKVFRFQGELETGTEDRFCPHCGSRIHINSRTNAILRHLCIGGNLSCVEFPRLQYRCPHCGATKMQFIPFKARMTLELYQIVTQQTQICKFFFNKHFDFLSSVPQRRIHEIILASSRKGNSGKLTDYAEVFPVHRITYGHFLSKGKWDEARVEETQRRESS